MRWVAALAGLALGAEISLLERRPDEVSFLQVGQGDCTLVRTGSFVMVVDAAAKTEYRDLGERLAAPELRSKGVAQIDILLLTHPDMDHVGGVGALARKFPIARVGFPEHFLHHPEFMALLGSLPASVDRIPLKAGSQLAWQGGRAEVDFVPWRPGEDDNLGSLCLRLVLPAGRVVMTGDAPSEAEAVIAQRGDWRAEILKTGHHGSRTSSSDEWLDEVKPKWAIVSAGRGNRYGHPHQEALSRFRSHGASVVRTDVAGTVTFEVRSSGFLRTAE